MRANWSEESFLRGSTANLSRISSLLIFRRDRGLRQGLPDFETNVRAPVRLYRRVTQPDARFCRRIEFCGCYRLTVACAHVYRDLRGFLVTSASVNGTNGGWKRDRWRRDLSESFDLLYIDQQHSMDISEPSTSIAGDRRLISSLFAEGRTFLPSFADETSMFR